MKLAIFRTDSSSQDPASYNSQEMGLAKGFSQLGHTVDIFIASDRDTLTTKTIRSSTPIIRIIYLPFKLVPFINEPIYRCFHKFLLSERYDYVQINEEGNFASWYIAKACYKAGLNFGIYQGMYKVLSGRRWALYELLHHHLLRPFLRRHSTGAFCKTSQASEFLISRGYKNTELVPVGLDFSRFQSRIEKNWRSILGIKEDCQLVLYVGRLEERRNPTFIAELAKKAGKGKHFVIVGEGPLSENLRKIKRQQELRNLSLIGVLRQEELPSLYEQADVLILPSNYEIYGMVVAEALYFGTPVVSTPTAGPVDMVADESHGILIDSLSTEHWLEAISSYGFSSYAPEKRSIRSNLARLNFDWTEIAKRYINLIVNR